MVLGTWRVMSPEQVCGDPVDARTDLFALGVLLYEALTGTSPFEAESQVGTLSRVILHRQTPAHKLNPAIPWQLSQLIDRLLEKTAAMRPVSAAEVRRELEEIAARLGTTSRSGAPAEDTLATEIELPTLVDLPVPSAAAPGPPAPLSSRLSSRPRDRAPASGGFRSRAVAPAERSPAISPSSRSRPAVCRRPARARRSPSSGSRISRRRGRAPGWARPSPK